MALETLSEDEWIKIMNESDEIGYCLVEPVKKWQPPQVNVEAKEDHKLAYEDTGGYIKFDTGILKSAEISCMLDTLPFDITLLPSACQRTRGRENTQHPHQFASFHRCIYRFIML
jgi:hypothetical protein